MTGEVFVLTGALSFGASNVAIRRGMKTARDDGVFISIFISAITFMVLIIILHLNRLLPPLTLRGFSLFALAGFLTSFTGRSLHYAAIRLLGPSRATSFRYSSPIITICLAFLFLSERFSIFQFVGATTVIGGVWVLSKEVLGRIDLGVAQTPRSNMNGSTSLSVGSNTSMNNSLVGILYALGAALSFGTGHFLRKLGLMEVPSPFWGLAIGTIVALLAVVVRPLIKGEMNILIYNNFYTPQWFFILAGFLMTIGQMFNYISIYFTAVSIVVVLASSEPLATLLISRLIMKGEEPLNFQVIACSGAVCLGVILMILK